MTSRTPLADGEHSILRAKVRTEYNADGRAVARVLDWRIRPHGFAKSLHRRTTGGARASDGSIRARALATAEELLRTDGASAHWTPSSRLGDYIREVVQTEITRARIAKNTRVRYLASLRYLVGDCPGHQHRHSLAEYTIRAGARFAELERALQEIAALHGEESARQARTVTTGYVLKSLLRARLIEYNALRGERIDLATGAKQHPGGKIGGIALTREQYEIVLNYLLTADPAEGIAPPRGSKWKYDQAVAKRRNAIELTLIQQATGLRLSEARQAWCGLLVESGTDLYIDVVAEIAKGGYARHAHIFNDQVTQRLRDRLARMTSPDELIVGAPSDPMKVWEIRNCTREMRSLYLTMAEELQLPMFQTERGHVWRATLNTLLIDVVPEVYRLGQFGHTARVNRRSYTDAAMPPDLVAVAQATIRR